jgi:hypothetical protein
VLVEYKNDLANMLKEYLIVDVRGKPLTYQKTVSKCSLAGFMLPSFNKFNGEDKKIFLSTLLNILPN